MALPPAPRPRLPSWGPPTYVSSTSTLPESGERSGATMHRRSFWSHDHAVSYDLKPSCR